MSKKPSKPEPASEPKPVKQERSLDDRLGEVLREFAAENGVKIYGKWADIPDANRENWLKRAATLKRIAAKHKLDIIKGE